MLGDRAPGATPWLPRRCKAAHAGPSLLGPARVRTRGASTAQLWLAPPLTLNTQNSRQPPPPPPGLAPAPHGTSRPPAARLPPPPAFRHRETLVPQTSVGAARRPRPLLLPGWGAPGPRHRGRGRDLQGWSPKVGGDFKRTSPSASPPPVAPEPPGRGAGAASRPPGASQRTGPDARGRGGRRRRGQRGNRRSSQDRRTRWGRRRGAGSGQRRPVANWTDPLGLGLRLEEGVQAGAWQVLRTLGSGL